MWLALAVSLAFGIWADDLGIVDSRVGSVLPAVLAYAAVAFGFCLAGLTVALSLSDETFVKELATRPPRPEQSAATREGANAYSDLLFVFSWTAVIHWLLLAYALGTLVICGPDGRVLADSADLVDRVRVALLVMVATYGVLQFLTTVVTLSQLGNRYVERVRARHKP